MISLKEGNVSSLFCIYAWMLLAAGHEARGPALGLARAPQQLRTKDLAFATPYLSHFAPRRSFPSCPHNTRPAIYAESCRCPIPPNRPRRGSPSDQRGRGGRRRAIIPSTHPLVHSLSRTSAHSPAHPSIHPPIHPSANPSIYIPTIHPSSHPSIHPSIHQPTHPSSHPSIHPFDHTYSLPSIHSSTHPSVHPSINKPSIHPYIHPLIHPSIHSSTANPKLRERGE